MGSMKQKLMMLGVGDLAWWTLEILLRSPGFGEHVEVLACDRDEEMGLRRVNSALLSASQWGAEGKVRFRRADAFQVDELAQIIDDFQPDVIFDSTTLQSWWVITRLPKEKYEEIDQARYGPWLPMHITLTYNLMKAIAMTRCRPKVINCGFPDVTNAVLAKRGMAPHIGIGNIDNVAPAVRMLLAHKEGVPLASVQVYMYLPHFVSYYLSRFHTAGGAPYILRLFVDGEEVTEKYDLDAFLDEATRRFRRLGGTGAHSVVGASCAKNILHVLRDTRTLTHSPGPCGLPGGYAVRIGTEKVEVALPPGLTLEEVIRVNSEAQKFDGIEAIQDDGTVVFTDRSYEIMKKLLGYDCKALKLEEAADRAQELRERFLRWAS